MHFLSRFFAPLLLLGAVLLAVPQAALAATTYYVSPSGSDSNSGTQAAPFLTIQHGINLTLSGDTVVIADGTYSGGGNRDLDFGGKNITVASASGDPARTVIDCGGTDSSDGSGNHRGFYFHYGETSAVISGLTIKNGHEDSYGGGYGYGGGVDIGLAFSGFRLDIATGSNPQDKVALSITIGGR